jgi:predicted ester cyclase
MTADELSAMARDIWETFNAHDVSDYDEPIAPDFVNHNAAPGTPNGPEGQRQVAARLYEAFPDLRFEIEDTFVADNRVAVLAG